MPRRCLADRLIEMTERDPALMLAPPGARFAFVALMRLAARMHTDGVVAFGSAIRNLAEVSIAVAIGETELRTHVETLVDRGVLVREGDALVCPALLEAGRKAAAARANGGLGGRPRRGETVEAARARRQGTMLLPVAGGKPTGTESETLSRVTATASSSQREESKAASKPREETETVMAVGRRVLEAAGIDEARWMGTFAEVRGWLAAGYAPELIVETVAAVAARPKYRPPVSLRYFAEAIRDAAGQGAAVTVEPSRPGWMDHPDYPAYRAACDAFRDSPYGPAPTMSEALKAARYGQAAA
jgi:hypothetical protein